MKNLDEFIEAQEHDIQFYEKELRSQTGDVVQTHCIGKRNTAITWKDFATALQGELAEMKEK